MSFSLNRDNLIPQILTVLQYSPLHKQSPNDSGSTTLMNIQHTYLRIWQAILLFILQSRYLKC